jgi:hypothetical protein
MQYHLLRGDNATTATGARARVIDATGERLGTPLLIRDLLVGDLLPSARPTVATISCTDSTALMSSGHLRRGQQSGGAGPAGGQHPDCHPNVNTGIGEDRWGGANDAEPPQWLHPDLAVILPPSAITCIHREWCLWLPQLTHRQPPGG